MRLLRVGVLALLLMGPALTGCIGNEAPLEATDTVPSTDAAEPSIAFSKIHAPSEITELVEGFDQLPQVETEVIGTSLEDRPLHLVTVGEGPFELWVVGRQHGDEPTGGEAILLAIQALAEPDASLPEDAPAIVHDLREHRAELLERITFLFVPVGNPDGAAAYQRETATGVDPNRDHFLFTQPATQAMREAFWAHRPDGCIDLHNEGIAENDFDAFGPVGPLLEEENDQRMQRDAHLGVGEVDAAGGRAGALNENYRSPEPADEYPWPTAVHPGTHDLFCTTRGAPGWTPEGAISGGSNGADDPMFAWSTRTHLVTIAASAFHWAGLYEATEPTVWKTSGTTAPGTSHTFELEEAADVTFQAVWREVPEGEDHSLTPHRFIVRAPDGVAYRGRAPVPMAWTSTVTLEDAAPGSYELQLDGVPPGSYELRSYVNPPGDPLVTVDRDGGVLHVAASATAQGPVEVTLTDVFDPADVAVEDFTPSPSSLQTHEGTVDTRTLARWMFTLDPGSSVEIEGPTDLEHRGPYRFTATDGETLHSELGPERNTGEPDV